MRFALVCALLVLSLRVHAGELPVVDDFRIVPQYPPPVAGAELTRGAAVRNTGQFVLWDGDAVYVQELIDNIPGPLFNVIGSGYAGNPSFVEVQTNNRTAFLGDGDAGGRAEAVPIRRAVVGQSLAGGNNGGAPHPRDDGRPRAAVADGD